MGSDGSTHCGALQVCDEGGYCFQYLIPMFNACLKPATAILSGIGEDDGGVGGTFSSTGYQPATGTGYNPKTGKHRVIPVSSRGRTAILEYSFS